MSRFFTLFLLAFIAFTSAAKAGEINIYQVDEVKTKVSAKSPSGARSAAIASARRDAFSILLSRLEKESSLLNKITNEELSDMVRSEQINDEKIAGNTYSATLNITFAKDFVEHILAKKNLNKSEEKSAQTQSKEEPTYLVVPIKIVKRNLILWEEINDWKKIFEKKLKQKQQQKKFIIPSADMENIATLNRQNLNLLDYENLEAMLARYMSDSAYVMFFNYNENENKVFVDVTYIRKFQKKQFRLSFVNVDHLPYATLLERVSEKTIDYLASTKIASDNELNSNFIHLTIVIKDLSDWLAVKSKIENSGFVSQLNVESLSRDYVNITLNYLDARTPIEEAFLRIGISLKKKSFNSYIIETEVPNQTTLESTATNPSAANSNLVKNIPN